MIRPLRVAALLAVLAVPLFARDPWDAAPFSTDPAALIAAAEKVPAGDASSVLLLDENRYSFEADGRMRMVTRRMIRVVDESAVDDEGTLVIGWAPWYYARPTIAARVVTKDGTVHMLDQTAVTEAPALDDLDIFSDNRLLRAPLPAVAEGSVIEYVITHDGKNPMAGEGFTQMFSLGGPWMPTQRARMVIEAPSSLEVRIVNKSGLQPKSEEKDGRRTTTFESDRLEARKNDEAYLPFDVTNGPYIAFTTGSSWGSLARKYSEIVDAQIAASDIGKFLHDAVGDATKHDEIIARSLAAIQKNVRYAGVEVGESSIVPRTPRVVLSNKYGDCKDKATLLVAMLRKAGIAAHVALLSSGMGFDVIPELPGLGSFNHAIVYLDGDGTWIDPTDEFARAGELPSADQGRLALVTAETTAALLRTPETPSATNRYAETRTFVLPEEGKARVTESSEASAAEDASQRRIYAGNDRKRYREQLESYVKDYYAAKKLEKLEAGDPHDLTKPFHITVEAAECGTGVVHSGDGAIALHPYQLVSWLPWVLRQSDEERAKDPESRPRQHDFVFPAPAVREWTFRVTPPAGYRARTLPQNETTKLGTITLSRSYVAQDDGTVLATLRVDSGKRRITAAEFEETRGLLSKMIKEKATTIGFDLAGQAKLNQGDVAGALAEFRKLAGLHPKEAQHHIELARALLVGGLGDAARAEIRRAVALEPQDARAQLALAGILEHDLLGRLLRTGFDMDGSLAALRKAKALDPKNVEVRSALAKLLTYNAEGVAFGKGARVEEAVTECRAAMKDLEEKESKGFAIDLMAALPFAGRFAEMQELAKTMDEGQARETGRIVGVAATSVAAALKELDAFDVATRRTYAAAVGQTLFRLRLYPQAADILQSGIQGGATASSAQPFIDILRKTKRVEEVPRDPSDPRTLVRDLFVALISHDMAAMKTVVADDIWDPKEAEESFESFGALRGKSRDMPYEVLGDLVVSMLRVQMDGSDKTGYRLRLHAETGAMPPLVVYVTREKDRYAIRAIGTDLESVGLAALRFADAGDLESARIWLNWLREEVTAGGGDDPMSGPPFAALWPKENPTADADQIRVAASVLLVKKEKTERALAALTAAREKASPEQGKWIDVAIVEMARKRKEWKTAIAAGERLFAAQPDSAAALTAYTTALAFGGRIEDAKAIAAKRLEKQPKDAAALRMLTIIAAKAHDYGAAARYAEQIVEQLTPTAMDYNNAAWFEMFVGDVTHALENARRATNDDKTINPAALHTLATVYAETGKNIEARDVLFRTLDLAQRNEPSSSDWYVIGRMAENYGVADAAIAAYKRVQNPEKEKEKDEVDEPGGTVRELAEKRLAALAAR
jgi:tetratricopeptide (TPR) repeat protein